MFLTGSLFPLGIFTVPIESQARPSGSLDGVWTSTIGVISLFSAPVTVFAGFYLDAGVTPLSSSRPMRSFGNCKTHRIRILCLVIAMSFACLSFVAYGIQTTNAVLIRITATFLSFPLGIIYLLATEVLMVWNPSRPGLTTGLGQMALSAGCILISSFYDRLISSRGCVQTFYIMAVMFCLISSFPMFMLRWPDRQHLLEQGSDSLLDPLDDCDLLATENVRIPWQKLSTLPIFWLFLFIVFTSAAPFALLAFFFKIGHVFLVPSSQILRHFQTVTVLSSCVSVLLIFLTDYARFGSRYFSSGAKNILTIMFILQSVLFIMLIPLSISSNFTMFIVVVTILLVMMASYNGCAAILVRDMFGSANAMVVFGMGAGIGMGSGEFLSTELMYFVESVSGGSSQGYLEPKSYIVFYAIAALWSMLGLVALLFVHRCDLAFRSIQRPSYSTIEPAEAFP